LGIAAHRQSGLTNLLEAVVAGDGRLPLRTALVSAASSLLSISTGASIGREGLIIQLSATARPRLGNGRNGRLIVCGCWLRAGRPRVLRRRSKRPIAGAVFAAQIVLGNFSMNLFAHL